jgi:hypothetical protein
MSVNPISFLEAHQIYSQVMLSSFVFIGNSGQKFIHLIYSVIYFLMTCREVCFTSWMNIQFGRHKEHHSYFQFSLQCACLCEYNKYVVHIQLKQSSQLILYLLKVRNWKHVSKNRFPVTFLFWPDDDRLGGRNMLPIFNF